MYNISLDNAPHWISLNTEWQFHFLRIVRHNWVTKHMHCSDSQSMLVTQSCLTLWDPTDYTQLGSSFHGFSRQDYGVGYYTHLQGNLPDPGIRPRSPTLQADSLSSEPPGNPLYIATNTEKSYVCDFWKSVTIKTTDMHKCLIIYDILILKMLLPLLLLY